jgi:two-component system chemotaxis sensor kinase CheA
VLRVRFARLSDSECELLAGELANLGKVVSRTRSNDQLTVLLETTCDPDDIVAVCCFVIDESQIDITREALPPPKRLRPPRPSRYPWHVAPEEPEPEPEPVVAPRARTAGAAPAARRRPAPRSRAPSASTSRRSTSSSTSWASSSSRSRCSRRPPPCSTPWPTSAS